MPKGAPISSRKKEPMELVVGKETKKDNGSEHRLVAFGDCLTWMLSPRRRKRRSGVIGNGWTDRTPPLTEGLTPGFTPGFTPTHMPAPSHDRVRMRFIGQLSLLINRLFTVSGGVAERGRRVCHKKSEGMRRDMFTIQRGAPRIYPCIAHPMQGAWGSRAFRCAHIRW
jgi:hypothetical protein